MSLASDWAAAVALEDVKVVAADALIPPGFNARSFSATVARDGGLGLNAAAVLLPAEALAFGQWIVATFG
jgi:hypothetical protein